jgi:hypothetical protein
MLSLIKLIRNTPGDVIERSSKTSVSKVRVKSSKSRGLNTLVFVATCQAITEKIFYDVTIELFPTEVHKDVYENPSEKNPAFVQCDCPFFLFHCEYALAKSGNAEIKFSNGKRPAVTNPKNVPYLCKHLYRAAPLVIKAAQDLAKRERSKYSIEKT